MKNVLFIDRRKLLAANACEEWVEWFDEVCALRGDDRAPLVRKGGVTRRDPNRLRVEVTPLVQIWLSLPLSPGSGTAWAWLRGRGFVAPVYAPDADLAGADLANANLGGAYLARANLAYANLAGARRSSLDAPIPGWVVREGRLTRV